MKYVISYLAVASFAVTLAQSPVAKAPEVKEGEGPFPQLIIRGVTLIDGTGAPPIGPVDIVVRQNRIERIAVVGFPGVPIAQDRRPKLEPNGKELNAEGMYLLPGFIDMHGHIGGSQHPLPNMCLNCGWPMASLPCATPPAATALTGCWIRKTKAPET